mmetsp:Transcript_4772/g.15200  ORF Transcript_4772/g.15200 Transcript_4772/m.15200 type:complete len:320 (-) Transcript_4772:15-974(-)
MGAASGVERHHVRPVRRVLRDAARLGRARARADEAEPVALAPRRRGAPPLLAGVHSRGPLPRARLGGVLLARAAAAAAGRAVVRRLGSGVARRAAADVALRSRGGLRVWVLASRVLLDARQVRRVDGVVWPRVSVQKFGPALRAARAGRGGARARLPTRSRVGDEARAVPDVPRAPPRVRARGDPELYARRLRGARGPVCARDARGLGAVRHALGAPRLPDRFCKRARGGPDVARENRVLRRRRGVAPRRLRPDPLEHEADARALRAAPAARGRRRAEPAADAGGRHRLSFGAAGGLSGAHDAADAVQGRGARRVHDLN